MSQTIILRFSDNERNTIAEHLFILTDKSHSHPYVYWGWWRPQDEDPKIDILGAFKRGLAAGSVRIGLANTKEGRFYVANCQDVEYSTAGQRIPAPVPEHTPAYYRQDRFPAWFKLTSIEELPMEGFVREFGFKPTGHETLFPVRDSVVSLTSTMESTVLQVPGEAILHISDLHFGEFHGFAVSGGGGAVYEKTLDDVIKDVLRKRGQMASRIGVIVVSGDIITKGDANSFGQARVFLEGLHSELGIPRDAVVIVPGNHDIYLKNSRHVTRDYSERQPYLDFLRSFFARDIREISGVVRFRTPTNKRLAFICLNSIRPRSEVLKDFGYIGEDVYQPLVDLVAGDTSQDSSELKIAVFHHHLVLPPIAVWPINAGVETQANAMRPISVMLDAGPLIVCLQRAGIQCAIHGHHHYPFIAEAGFKRDDDPSVVVIGGGSAGAKRDQLEEAFSFNSLGIYTPTTNAIAVELWKYNRATQAELILNKDINFAR
jgi:predicted MPP superfamily phosphohydrolase